MQPFIHGAEIVLYAAMATSAANLARLHGKYVPSGSRNASTATWVPEPSHKLKAFFYAGKALSLATRQAEVDAGILIPAQVLLSMVEAELGTFEGLRRYLDSLGCLVSRSRDELVGSSPACRELVGTALGYRLLQSLLSGMSWDSRVSSDGCLASLGMESSSIFQVLGWEAVTLDARLGLLQAMCHSKSHPNPLRERQIGRVASRCAPRILRRPLGQLALETIERELEQTRSELERLSQAFRPCQPPVEFVVSMDRPALQFRTHEEAMAAADFVFCRIMCNEALVDSMSLPSASVEMPALTRVKADVALGGGFTLIDLGVILAKNEI